MIHTALCSSRDMLIGVLGLLSEESGVRAGSVEAHQPSSGPSGADQELCHRAPRIQLRRQPRPMRGLQHHHCLEHCSARAVSLHHCTSTVSAWPTIGCSEDRCLQHEWGMPFKLCSDYCPWVLFLSVSAREMLLEGGLRPSIATVWRSHALIAKTACRAGAGAATARCSGSSGVSVQRRMMLA